MTNIKGSPPSRKKNGTRQKCGSTKGKKGIYIEIATT